MDEERQFLANFGISEAWELVKRWECYRERRDGERQLLTVSVYHGGSEMDHPYRAEAATHDGLTAHGNADATILGALENVHWFELDRDRREPEPHGHYTFADRVLRLTPTARKTAE